MSSLRSTRCSCAGARRERADRRQGAEEQGDYAAAASQQGSPNSLGRRTYQKGLQTLAWKADDENDDDAEEQEFHDGVSMAR